VFFIARWFVRQTGAVCVHLSQHSDTRNRAQASDGRGMKARIQILFGLSALLCSFLAGCASDETEVTTRTTTETTEVHAAPTTTTTETRTVGGY
jgi:hypothetical protein